MADKPVVLFLGTENSARRQMAEAFLRKYGGDRFEVSSAGYEPTEINPLTRRVMAEAGLDLAGQRAKSVAECLGKLPGRYLITLCDRAERNCPTAFPQVFPRLFWAFPDPVAASGTGTERLTVFRRVRDQIEARIVAWLRETTPLT